ncbi:MAG: NAD(P)/FAD-dependent oxidoreductase [Chthoniobacteraceae bacterium]
MVSSFQVAIVGAGPAGSTCAALCAAAGLRTLLFERATFPREKVCGDCLNPACWPVLDRLGVSARLAALTHARITAVEFIGTDGNVLTYPLPAGARGEIAIKRSALDRALLARAMELGATVKQGAAVTALEPGWRIQVGDEQFTAETLVAADGRNSTVARLLGLLPAAHKDRLGLQAHLPAPPEWANKVTMRLLPFGYCGVADVGGGEVNACLVARAQDLDRLKAWAQQHFALPRDQSWRSIAPLARAALPPVHERLVLIGDAARVVEPFTGEGIYYALASGALAADAIVADDLGSYAAAHRELYRGRLWVNELAKSAVLYPRIATQALRLTRAWPQLLGMLTAKVIRSVPA